jgi:hypothetical protein
MRRRHRATPRLYPHEWSQDCFKFSFVIQCVFRVRVHGPRVTVVQKPTRRGSMRADPAARGPEATPQGASVSSDRRAPLEVARR